MAASKPKPTVSRHEPGRLVLWAANDRGYVVQVYNTDGSVMESYTAGNHAKCSQTFVEPGSVNAVSEAALRMAAQITAKELAQQYGKVFKISIHEDEDLVSQIATLEEEYD